MIAGAELFAQTQNKGHCFQHLRHTPGQRRLGGSAVVGPRMVSDFVHRAWAGSEVQRWADLAR